MGNVYQWLGGIFFIFVALDLWAYPADYSEKNRHNSERTAWGGNGGSWGVPHSEFSEEYGWRNRNPRTSRSYYSQYLYCRTPSYPYAEQYASENVDGAALYFTIR